MEAPWAFLVGEEEVLGERLERMAREGYLAEDLHSLQAQLLP